jgi:mutator protein MutT
MTKIAGKPITVAIAVLEHDEKFLVGVRPPGVPLAGLAEFPGGKIDPGETPEAAAVRECREETGLAVEVVGEYFSTMHQYEHGLLEIHFFRCHPVGAGSFDLQPTLPFRWVNRDELARLEFPAANAPLTKHLLSTT